MINENYILENSQLKREIESLQFMIKFEELTGLIQFFEGYYRTITCFDHKFAGNEITLTIFNDEIYNALQEKFDEVEDVSFDSNSQQITFPSIYTATNLLREEMNEMIC